MIRPLRQRHRRTLLALGVFLPVAFVVAIAARKPLPEVNTLPPEFFLAAAQFDLAETQPLDGFLKVPVRIRLLREKPGAGKFAVELSAAKDFVKPDLLVYWSAGNQNLTNALPDNAILLGAFAAPQLWLPAAATQSDGVLVLYSLADNEIVDVSQTIRLNVSNP